MKAFNLMNVNRNAYSIVGYVLNAMEAVYYYCSVTSNEAWRKDQFGIEVQTAYKESALSGDYRNLLCVSLEMIKKVNEFIKIEPAL